MLAFYFLDDTDNDSDNNLLDCFDIEIVLF